jgi:hypothetical protein
MINEFFLTFVIIFLFRREESQELRLPPKDFAGIAQPLPTCPPLTNGERKEYLTRSEVQRRHVTPK